ncbi:MAG TPA: MFS transporter [Vicinamibacteria bacterium]|nr:MFS transporter [Vicinamibacteria bacterium]
MTEGEAGREARSLGELSAAQWKSGLAAWLGWFFDGLDMHLYTLVAAPFVMELLAARSPADPLVREKSSFVQAAFLTGWALGGGLFGRVGDRLGRSRALSLTILTYALFTGLSYCATSWWQLLAFRFLSALGIGGEWAVGSSLLAETWPRRWGPWIAAVLQSGVNMGVMLAAVTVYVMADGPPRNVFLVGILPALVVFWIRRNVPEPAEWATARSRAEVPRLSALLGPGLRATTLKTVLVCSLSLTAWWAFMFWNPQHLRNLPELGGWERADRERLVSFSFAVVIGVSIVGNFFAGWLASRIGYRNAIVAMFVLAAATMAGGFGVERGHESLVALWLPAVGFASGVFGLFTMFLPPLYPTLLRTTGAGFSYNVGRLAAAGGTVLFGLLAPLGDFRLALLWAGALFGLAACVALSLPDLPPAGDGALLAAAAGRRVHEGPPRR